MEITVSAGPLEEGSNYYIWDTCSLQKIYESNISPSVWSATYTGLEADVGVVASTANELLPAVKTRLGEDWKSIKLHLPEFNNTGVAYYQDSSLDWICLLGGGIYVDMGLKTEISWEIQTNTNINFPVGGAIKMSNSVIYVCSPHVANVIDHPADFPIFLAWCLYQQPVVTNDTRHLNRDLIANGATVYSVDYD